MELQEQCPYLDLEQKELKITILASCQLPFLLLLIPLDLNDSVTSSTMFVLILLILFR